jgi:NTP pyrophosphatase (non-canonical NTP hydrolase)
MNLKELQDCAREENARIEEHYSFPSESTRILAHMAKVTEEVGELGEAILLELGYQRPEKLARHKKEDLEKEFADVIYTATILATLLDVDLDTTLQEKITEIKKRSYRN